jgi:ribokinase
MSDKSIIVVGSSNTDMVIQTDKFPQPGETLLGGKFFMFPGGKGANQAVSAARLGGKVTFIAKTGNDIFGKQALQQFANEGIRCDLIVEDDKNPSGVALITVDEKGENTIVVAQGANGALTVNDIMRSENEIANGDFILMQLEIPLPTVIYVAETCSKAGIKVILNPAPAMTLPRDIFNYLYCITPNETEAESLTGISITDMHSTEKAAMDLLSKGVQNVVITLGSKGAYLLNSAGGKHIAAPVVKAVDTTAAGDVFNGALVVALSEGKTFAEAVTFANNAAALSVTKMGAQSSAPFRHEMKHTPIKQ